MNKELGVDKRTAGNLRVCRMDICILHHRGIFKTNINLNLSRCYHFYLLLLFRVTWGFITPLPLSPIICHSEGYNWNAALLSLCRNHGSTARGSGLHCPRLFDGNARFFVNSCVLWGPISDTSLCPSRRCGLTLGLLSLSISTWNMRGTYSCRFWQNLHGRWWIFSIWDKSKGLSTNSSAQRHFKKSKKNQISIFGEKVSTSLVAQLVKYLPTIQDTQVQSLGRKVPWRRKWQPTPVLLPREFQGQNWPWGPYLSLLVLGT